MLPELSAALAALPDLGVREEALRATGTVDPFPASGPETPVQKAARAPLGATIYTERGVRCKIVGLRFKSGLRTMRCARRLRSDSYDEQVTPLFDYAAQDSNL